MGSKQVDHWTSGTVYVCSKITGSPAADYVGLADVNDVVPGPDSDGEGAGPAAQNGIGAIVEQLERSDDAAVMDPDEGGAEELGWQLAGQLGARIVPKQGKSRNIQCLSARWPSNGSGRSLPQTRPQ